MYLLVISSISWQGQVLDVSATLALVRYRYPGVINIINFNGKRSHVIFIKIKSIGVKSTEQSLH